MSRNKDILITLVITALMFIPTLGTVNNNENVKADKVCSLTVYADETDGTFGEENTSYYTVWNRQTALINAGDGGWHIGCGQANIFGLTYFIERSVVFFDTSAIYDNAIIVSATLRIYYEDSYFLSSDDVIFSKANVNCPLQLSDYNKACYSGDYGHITLDDIGTWYEVSLLHPADIISKTGMTKIGMRTASEVAGIPPALGKGFVPCFSSSEGEYPAVLTIVWTVPN